ncbi:M15 family metallopeptidase [Alistipes sp. OttesenSCG-928-L06]|nr:M15 family metallopeptidase [Alistipes sp. OttesenSCG-928-L06]
MRKWWIILLPLLCACAGRNPSGQAGAAELEQASVEAEAAPISAPALSPTARRLDSLGYVNIVDLDPTLAVHMVYATPDNFVGEVLYGDLTEAYLLPEAAEKLAAAHELLKEKHPHYRFIIYDAARPMAVQRRMWSVAVKTGKQYYVANPANGGGLHNYGAAVDLSILDERGVPLPMGTDYDHLGPEANTNNERSLVAAGKLTEQELQNRLLLRDVMRRAGFRTVTSEWWHFNHSSRAQAKEKYPIIDF